MVGIDVVVGMSVMMVVKVLGGNFYDHKYFVKTLNLKLMVK